MRHKTYFRKQGKQNKSGDDVESSTKPFDKQSNYEARLERLKSELSHATLSTLDKNIKPKSLRKQNRSTTTTLKPKIAKSSDALDNLPKKRNTLETVSFELNQGTPGAPGDDDKYVNYYFILFK